MEYGDIRVMLVQGITDDKTIEEIDSMIDLCSHSKLGCFETIRYIIDQIYCKVENKIINNSLSR